MLIHNVYFTLNDPTEDNIAKLIAEAEKYLKSNSGLVHFAVGKLAKEYNRPVNDHSYDVCLNTVFKDKQAHDEYQVCAEHKQFIANNKDGWKTVRVCDSEC